MEVKASRGPSKWRKQGLALCLGLIVGLMILEGGLRVARYFFPIDLLVGYSLPPINRYPGRLRGGFRLNNFGFKDLDFSVKKNHKVRIVALGDSFAYGVVPYEYNYLTLLEQALQSDGLDVDVLNMGIPCIGPDEYLHMLRHEVLLFRPDIVLVSFFVGNDFIESSPPRSYQWFERFYAYECLKCLCGFFASTNEPLAGFYPYHDNEPTLTEKNFFEIERKRSVIFRKGSDLLRGTSQNVRAIIKEMAAICRKNGVTLAFVLIPDQMQVDRQLQQQLSARFPKYIPEEQMQWDAPNKALARYLSALGIAYVDLWDAFRTNGQAFYKPRNTHWNIAGNALAAGQIKAAVINLLPKETK